MGEKSCKAGKTGLTNGFRVPIIIRQSSAAEDRKERGIAQLVARLVRDQEASGSSPDTPTTKKGHL